MIRFTAFLVALTLASLPSMSSVCVTWCSSQLATHCRDAESPAVVSGDGTCVSLNESPLLPKEANATTPLAGLWVSQLPGIFRLRAVESFIAAHRITRDAAPSPPAVLRL
jgi:hypothetical protein